MTDKQIIQGIINNNDLAFRSLLLKYKNLVYNTAFRLVKNQSDADDIFQEVFLEIFKSCSLIQNEEDLTCWIYKIAYHKSISFLRKKNPAKANSFPENNLIPNPQQINKNTPQFQLEQKEAVSNLYRFIDQLPQNQKKVLLLHKFEGLSQLEIGEQLNLSITAVESLIYRAKKNLKHKLTQYFKLNS